MGQFTFKSNASQSPTALGSLQAASPYGATIPTGYGMTQSPLLPIWAANLRQGGGVKKFKQFKKGITNYVENIDYLIGHNPIRGVLQCMVNGGNYPLTFTSQSFTAAAGSGSYEVTDSDFYFVVAVTLEASYSFPVNDFGGSGPQTLTGTFEIPLWNENETGPDPTAPSTYRFWPYCYRWVPGSGATVTIDAEAFPGGTLNVYYAKLMDATSFEVPITKLNCSFENQLGSGDEYSNAPVPFNEQQIVYPQYAGLGSSEIDLGASGALPQLLPEVAFKWGIYPSGDADFVDMIEDVYKSGMAQAAVAASPAYTQQERGLSSYDMPGTIQKKVDASASAALPPMTFDMQNTEGNFLVCAVTAAGTLSISSTAGDAWARIYADASGFQVWYAVAAGGANTVTVSGASAPWQMALMEINGVGFVSPVPPVPPVPGDATSVASVATPSSTSSASGTGTASATETTGMVQIEVVGGLFQECTGEVAWSNYTVPTLPDDAVVTAVRAVLSISSSINGGSPNLIVVPGITTGAIPGDGTIIGANILSGTLEDTINGFSANMSVGNSGGFGPAFTTSITVAYLGLIVIYTSASSGGGSGILDSIATVESSTTGVITSSVQKGFPAYLLAIALYGSDEAPAAAQNGEWDPVTPANFYSNATTTMQLHERIVRNPGAYAITEKGPTPASLLLMSFKAVQPVNYPRPLGDFIDIPSFDLVRRQCRANGLWGSLSMNSQAAASDWIKTLCAAANAAPVFLGSKLYLYPYSEVSTAGNGCTYTAPTASGPVANLSDLNGDFVGSGTPTEDTAVRIGLPNVLQMQCIDRNTNYNQITVSQPDSVSIALYGQRKADPVVNNAVQDPTIARSLLGIKVRRNQYGGDSWSFQASARWSLLSPMDLITLTDTLQGITLVPVRITSFKEQSDGSFQGTAEPFIYGMCAPTPLSTSSPVVNGTTTSVSAGDVNPPVIFEPVPGLYPVVDGGGVEVGGIAVAGSVTPAELWVVVSSAADNYGGAQVFISTDGGSSYQPAPGLGASTTNVITGSAVTGSTSAGWPAAADPDSTNNLHVDLTESDGVLQSYSTAQENNFEYPCYVGANTIGFRVNGTVVANGAPLEIDVDGTAVADAGTVAVAGSNVAQAGDEGIPYELMTYAIATLTATSKYELMATGSGNFLRRSVYGAPTAGEGVDHPAGSRFAFLNPSGTGILKMQLPAQYVGQTLYFKICSFNQFGSALQSLADVVPYAYVPTGIPGGL